MTSEPTRIGRYQVQRVLGGGAMGIVYLAQDPLLKRPVAIKIVREGTEEEHVLLERFHREAEVSARLNHPNIITVFDVGEDPESGPYLAMEYVEGASLAALIHDGLTPEAGLRLLIQGMGALIAAEEAGIAHRDVKPDNILVSKDGRFKLMDFGIARSGESRLTMGGVVFGTPSYTAPELLVGLDASPATDRYAFAVTAFEVMTGTLPFQGRTVGTTLYRIVHEPPEMPPGLNPRMEKVFQKALAKREKDRYDNLPTFMIDLVLASNLPPESQEALLTLIHENPMVRSRLGRSTHPFDLRPEPTRPPEPPPPPEPRREPTGTPPPLPPPLPPAPQPVPVVKLPRPIASLRAATPRPEPGHPSSTPRSEPARPSSTRLTVLAAVAALVLLVGVGITALRWLSPYRTIDVYTSPPGAEVRLDGLSLGRTPLSQVRVKNTATALRLELRGYLPATRRIGPKDSVMYFTLEPVPWQIAVITDPPGAEVYLDDKRVGTTPMEALAVPGEGAPELVLKREGYEEWRALLDRNAPFPADIRMTPLNPKARKRR